MVYSLLGLLSEMVKTRHVLFLLCLSLDQKSILSLSESMPQKILTNYVSRFKYKCLLNYSF